MAACRLGDPCFDSSFLKGPLEDGFMQVVPALLLKGRWERNHSLRWEDRAAGVIAVVYLRLRCGGRR